MGKKRKKNYSGFNNKQWDNRNKNNRINNQNNKYNKQLIEQSAEFNNEKLEDIEKFVLYLRTTPNFANDPMQAILFAMLLVNAGVVVANDINNQTSNNNNTSNNIIAYGNRTVRRTHLQSYTKTQNYTYIRGTFKDYNITAEEVNHQLTIKDVSVSHHKFIKTVMHKPVGIFKKNPKQSDLDLSNCKFKTAFSRIFTPKIVEDANNQSKYKEGSLLSKISPLRDFNSCTQEAFGSFFAAMNNIWYGPNIGNLASGEVSITGLKQDKFTKKELLDKVGKILPDVYFYYAIRKFAELNSEQLDKVCYEYNIGLPLTRMGVDFTTWTEREYSYNSLIMDPDKCWENTTDHKYHYGELKGAKVVIIKGKLGRENYLQTNQDFPWLLYMHYFYQENKYTDEGFLCPPKLNYSNSLMVDLMNRCRDLYARRKDLCFDFKNRSFPYSKIDDFCDPIANRVKNENIKNENIKNAAIKFMFGLTGIGSLIFCVLWSKKNDREDNLDSTESSDIDLSRNPDSSLEEDSAEYIKMPDSDESEIVSDSYSSVEISNNDDNNNNDSSIENKNNNENKAENLEVYRNQDEGNYNPFQFFKIFQGNNASQGNDLSKKTEYKRLSNLKL